METADKKMLRAKDISKIYGVCLSSVWNYAKKGYLKPYKITSGLTMFDPNEVAEFFKVKK